MKGFALRLVLKQRHKRTRKWPIDQHDTSVGKRKKSEPPTGIKQMTSEHWVGALSTKLQELIESKVI